MNPANLTKCLTFDMFFNNLSTYNGSHLRKTFNLMSKFYVLFGVNH